MNSIWRPIKTVSLFIVLLALTACSSQPVAPWERGNLARPEMVRNASAHNIALQEHTYSSKEAAMGGYGLGGGGCGCN